MSPEQVLNVILSKVKGFIVILSVSEGSERVRFFGKPRNDGRAVNLRMTKRQ